ncbi:hypothetical protein [Paracoccus sulfuroxidans]|uniref:Phosphate transport system permease protein n=1 Tax=Paracoccus sulfuroxidans TaxID=384678 RepID=A0A562N473_9RHOB|nr:hypothetical protein [Paracoccus sulfuroxidans]AZV00317.1 hypothetical protein psul1_p09 [Paracoccus phage vB_PsuS_Psul1]TWI26944.1 hypothetical protein IQ24_04001 [Paracoccus sulfuroxidans]
MHPALTASAAPANLPRLLINIMRGALLATSVIAAAILLLVIWHILSATLSWSEVRDFVAPTAAQARDGGWVALSERAAP